MILHTQWEDLNNAVWDVKVEYAYFPKIEDVVILNVYRQEPVKHIDDLQWVGFYQYDNSDFMQWENECVAQELEEAVCEK